MFSLESLLYKFLDELRMTSFMHIANPLQDVTSFKVTGKNEDLSKIKNYLLERL